METGSVFGIYGQLFGWHVFDQAINFIAISGLWAVPFIVFVYRHSFGNRERGQGHDPVGSLVGMELSIYVAILLIAFFLYPLVSMPKADFKHTVTTSAGTTINIAGNTGSTFDAYDSALPGDVKIPVGWYGILKFVGGINAVMQSLLPTGDSIRSVMQQVQHLSIENPELREEFREFEARCATPARAKFNAIMEGEYANSQMAQSIKQDIQDYVAADETHTLQDWQINLRYPGNEIFQNYLYLDYGYPPCNNVAESQTSLCMPPHGIYTEASSYGAESTCNAWWDSLSTKVHSEFESVLGGETWNPTFEVLQNRLGVDDAYNETINNRLTTAPAMEDGLNPQSGFFPWAEKTTAAVLTHIGNFFNGIANEVTKVYLPLAQGLFIMLLIMVMPILILFGGLRLETVITLGFVFFSVLFWSALWHVITWVDQIMLESLWGWRGFLDKATSLEMAVWGVIILVAYAAVPYFWSTMMMTVGQRVAGTVSNGLSQMGSAEAGYQKGVGTRAANAAKGATWNGTRKAGATTWGKLRGK